jgi:hypothetical protein
VKCNAQGETTACDILDCEAQRTGCRAIPTDRLEIILKLLLERKDCMGIKWIYVVKRRVLYRDLWSQRLTLDAIAIGNL